MNQSSTDTSASAHEQEGQELHEKERAEVEKAQSEERFFGPIKRPLRWQPARPYRLIPDDAPPPANAHARRCTAVNLKSGRRCKNMAVAGSTTCRFHGAGSPGAGRAPGPAIQRGRHSRYLPRRLMETYQRGMTDPDLLALRDEIVLLDARINDLLKEVRKQDSKESTKTWRQISSLVESRRRLAVSERDRLIKAGQTVTTENLVSFVGAVLEILRKRLEHQQFVVVARDLQKMIGASSGMPMQKETVDNQVMWAKLNERWSRIARGEMTVEQLYDSGSAANPPGLPGATGTDQSTD